MDIRNIEIKLAIDDAVAARESIHAVADGPAARLHQVDTYFDVGTAAFLKLRQESRDGGPETASLIAYRRTLDSAPEPSDIRLLPVDDGDGLRDTLAHAMETLAVVRKTRDLFFRGQTRIHLDDVENLGAFVELEVVLRSGQSESEGRRIASDLLDRLKLAGARAQTESYRDLVRRSVTARHPDRPVLRGGPAGG